MRTKVISSDGTDQTGLIFYNVGTAHNVLKQGGIYVVQSLGLLTARRIRDISELSALDGSKFSSEYGGKGDCDISELLFVCNAEFKKTSSSYRPRMFIFTSDDNPCGTDRRARKAAITRANDFHEGLGNGAEINVIPLKSGVPFKVEKFWDQVILYSADPSDVPDEGTDESNRFVASALIQLEEMGRIMLRKIFKKRPLNRVNLWLSDDVSVALMIYTSYFPASKPKHIYVDATDFKPLRSDTKFINDFSGEIVDPNPRAGEVETVFDIPPSAQISGSKRVKLSRDEILEMRQWPNFSSPNDGVTGALRIIGFKSLEYVLNLPPLGHSCFLYPQENRIFGSSKVVAGMIDRMIERKLCAICHYIPKANSQPLVAALIPQPEVMDSETGRQEKSPGFFLVRLPFQEEVRPLSLPDTNVGFVMSKDASIDRVRQEQVHAAIRVVEGVSEEEWVPEILDNPALQQCYVSLEAMALNLPASEVGRVTDLLGPDPSKIEAVDERRIQDWLKSLNLSDTSACSLSSGLIKKEESRAKSSIKEEQLSQYTIEQIRQLVSDGQIERLTVTEMKGIIRSFPDVFKNVSTAGKKADLLEKIRLNI
jgi:ATP-dependent DNA helicase 2 subunit 1